ncbi:molybdenum cofactor cytidylyltransferase [Jannaschia faecimaris]|uniref:Molybdenum cofactor cytidylyltransferase n=1 Tax=Jannaschia faecimaris TaxID=1244108 RepID=A0A1H3RLT3_9RHOB|nr:molybdopterin-binding protein [Jannaschia faecimaris]SDZ26563.1 molybdenum cofactor cytidylyltransferase [Jannaschia faecimaris]
MKFGSVPVEIAQGAVLAHTLTLGAATFRKGSVVTGDAVAAMRAQGVTEVIVARLDPADVPENIAAARLAAALAGDGLDVREAFTGRANLHAAGPGVVGLNVAAIDAVNAVDPMITVATLPQWQRVAGGTMAATVKIIAYAVDSAALDRACAAGRGAMRLHPPALRDADLIVTHLGSGGPVKVGPVIDRLARLGVETKVSNVAHDVDALSEALTRATAPLRLILTASATSDVADVGPSALAGAGGTLTRFGMPVDPGNLLFLGEMAGATVIGLPGCARSPALNGADWVLERIVCGVPVSEADIAAMGVGGLLKEIPTRPQPRERR